MSPSLLISLFSFLVLFSVSNAATKPRAFIFPIKKESTTLQYYTTIQIGANSTSLDVVIDLGGKFLWFNSAEYFAAATTYRPIRCGTKLCQISNGVGCVFCFLSPPVPGCTNNTCSDYAHNPFTGTLGYSGLGEDTLHVQATNGAKYVSPHFPFQFSDPVLKEGLAPGTQGLIGLGRTNIALQAQLASRFKIPQKFALCISSSGDGNIIIGGGPYKAPFQEISKSLISTPLIKNPVETYPTEKVGNSSVEYFINVKSIIVGNKTLLLNTTLLSFDKNGNGGTNLRTVRPYTILHRSIFRALVNEFVKEAAAIYNIKRVASVAPFGACFDSKTIANSKTGPVVPTIDLVLQSKKVYWRFYGENSMVKVNNDVLCLGFVDGGLDPVTSISIGGHQLENYVLEFDVTSSMLLFSPSIPSILPSGTSCSQFKA
ncbi:Eukaryotic aspartyl protease family protein [Abeliophyllum distichum]|uniref:Eukaryotic aspartyl protease family protein n=1 Tax=Abeliophyllum distichum TaxID=126358 RepID=A0ABD1RXN3_9LAMI